MGRSIQSRLREKNPRGPSLQQAAREALRGTTNDRGYDADWIKVRAQHLRLQPACVDCGLVDKSNHVDHVIPHRGDDRLRLDPGNLQTLCQRHHARKTAAKDGGFGNKLR